MHEHTPRVTADAAALGPHIRLALLRLCAQARSIRERLQLQSADPGEARRSWPWIRASLAGELDVAMVHALHALQALHEAVFDSREVVRVKEIRQRVDAMAGCLGHMLSLHRDVAAALPRDEPSRAAILSIIERPLHQLADFFDAMQGALEMPWLPDTPAPADIEIRLSIDLDFAAQLSVAESASAVPPRDG